MTLRTSGLFLTFYESILKRFEVTKLAIGQINPRNQKPTQAGSCRFLRLCVLAFEVTGSALNDVGNRWCKRAYVETNALKEWKVSIFKIVDQRIKFHSQNTNLLPHKPKSTFRHLKQGIQDFHRKYVLVPADKAANNVVVI